MRVVLSITMRNLNNKTMNKQAHLKTIAVLGLTAIMVLLATYFPLTGIVVFTTIAFIAMYMAIYTFVKD